MTTFKIQNVNTFLAIKTLIQTISAVFSVAVRCTLWENTVEVITHTQTQESRIAPSAFALIKEKTMSQSCTK